MSRAGLRLLTAVLFANLMSCGASKEYNGAKGPLRITMHKEVFNEGEEVWYYLQLFPRPQDDWILSCVDAANLAVDLTRDGRVATPIPLSTDNPSTSGHTRFAGVYDQSFNLVLCPIDLISTVGLQSLVFRVPLNYDAGVTHEVFELTPGKYELSLFYSAYFGYEYLKIMEKTGVTEISDARIFGSERFLQSNKVSFRIK